MKFAFKLTGLTPILFHADDVMQSDRLDEWRKDPDNAAQSVKGDDRSPPWTWHTYLYGDGANLCIPSDNLLVALRWAGAKVILKKNETYKSLTQSGLLIDSEYVRFDGPKGQVRLAEIKRMEGRSFAEQAQAVKALGFSLFVKRAKIGQSKHVRVRARFDEWSANGVIEIINPDLQPATLKQIGDIAGDRAGLLDWRPSSKQSPGPFGRFSFQLKPLK
jgi:hypothetical protein